MSRLIALGLALALGLGALGLVGGEILRAREAAATRVADAETTLARLERAVAERAAHAADPEALGAARAILAEASLEGASMARAAAALQARARAIVEAAGATAISLEPEPLPAEEGEDVGRVRLRLRMTGDATALQEVLHALETPPPVLIVEAMTKRARRAASPYEAPALDVDLTATGFLALDGGG